MPSKPVKAGKQRLDTLLVQRGFYSSRTRAAAALIAGDVYVGEGRDRSFKAGQLVSESVKIECRQRSRYVSRGGDKLHNALAALAPPVRGRLGMDVGAATGGFTDCLLKHGASQVIAVDVGKGSLAWELTQSERVLLLADTNARNLTAQDLPYRPDIIAVDVSFISLTKVLPAVLACAAPGFDCLAMIKPQFEVGADRVGSGGVVRSESERRRAVITVAESVQRLGYSVTGFASSGLPGPKGNLETFMHVRASGDGAAEPQPLEHLLAEVAV